MQTGPKTNDWVDNVQYLSNNTVNHNVLIVTKKQDDDASTLEKRAGSTTLVLDTPEAFYGDKDNQGVFPKWLQNSQGETVLLTVVLKSDVAPAVVLENLNTFLDSNQVYYHGENGEKMVRSPNTRFALVVTWEQMTKFSPCQLSRFEGVVSVRHQVARVNDWVDNALYLSNNTENHNVLLVTKNQDDVASTLEKRGGSTTLVLDTPEAFYGKENLGVFPTWLKSSQGETVLLTVVLKSDMAPAEVLENLNTFLDSNQVYYHNFSDNNGERMVRSPNTRFALVVTWEQMTKFSPYPLSRFEGVVLVPQHYFQ